MQASVRGSSAEHLPAQFSIVGISYPRPAISSVHCHLRRKRRRTSRMSGMLYRHTRFSYTCPILFSLSFLLFLFTVFSICSRAERQGTRLLLYSIFHRLWFSRLSPAFLSIRSSSSAREEKNPGERDNGIRLLAVSPRLIRVSFISRFCRDSHACKRDGAYLNTSLVVLANESAIDVDSITRSLFFSWNTISVPRDVIPRMEKFTTRSVN